MSRQASGYARQPRELYTTPEWVVTEGLAPHLPIEGKIVWEPACGTGRMVRALHKAGAKRVYASDIDPEGYGEQVGLFDDKEPLPKAVKRDFLSDPTLPARTVDLIVTNPPYGLKSALAHQFLGQGIALVRKHNIGLALLFPIDFGCADVRRSYFADCPEFDIKIELTKRINWFEGTSGQSEHHAWFVWHRKPYPRPPLLRYAP